MAVEIVWIFWLLKSPIAYRMFFYTRNILGSVFAPFDAYPSVNLSLRDHFFSSLMWHTLNEWLWFQLELDMIFFLFLYIENKVGMVYI